MWEKRANSWLPPPGAVEGRPNCTANDVRTGEGHTNHPKSNGGSPAAKDAPAALDVHMAESSSHQQCMLLLVLLSSTTGCFFFMSSARELLLILLL